MSGARLNLSLKKGRKRKEDEEGEEKGEGEKGEAVSEGIERRTESSESRQVTEVKGDATVVVTGVRREGSGVSR